MRISHSLADAFLQHLKDNTRTLRGLADETREETAYAARSDEIMTIYESCVPDDEKISSPEAGQRRFRACDDDSPRDAFCTVTRSQILECRVPRRDTFCCITIRSQRFECRVFRLLCRVTSWKALSLFEQTEKSQRRAQCKPKRRIQRTQTEAHQPKRRDDEHYEFQEIRYKTTMLKNCKNIIEGVNEDHDEALYITVYVKTFNGKTISI